MGCFLEPQRWRAQSQKEKEKYGRSQQSPGRPVAGARHAFASCGPPGADDPIGPAKPSPMAPSGRAKKKQTNTKCFLQDSRLRHLRNQSWTRTTKLQEHLCLLLEEIYIYFSNSAEKLFSSE